MARTIEEIFNQKNKAKSSDGVSAIFDKVSKPAQSTPKDITLPGLESFRDILNASVSKTPAKSEAPRIGPVKTQQEPKIKGGELKPYEPSFLDSLKNLFTPRRTATGSLTLPALQEVRESDTLQSFASSAAGQNEFANSLIGSGINALTGKIIDKSYEKAAERGELPYGIPKEPEKYVPQSTAGKVASFGGAFFGDAPLMPINILSGTLKAKTALNPIAREAISQGLTGGTLGAAQGIVEGDSASEVAQRAAFGTVLGGALGGAVKGIPQIPKAIRTSRENKAIQELSNSITLPEVNLLEEIQKAYKKPSLRDVRQAELSALSWSNDTIPTITPSTPLSSVDEAMSVFGGRRGLATMGMPNQTFKTIPSKRRQRITKIYEDLWDELDSIRNTADATKFATKADAEAAFRQIDEYGVKSARQIELERLFGDRTDDTLRNAAREGATPEMYFGKRTPTPESVKQMRSNIIQGKSQDVSPDLFKTLDQSYTDALSWPDENFNNILNTMKEEREAIYNNMVDYIYKFKPEKLESGGLGRDEYGEVVTRIPIVWDSAEWYSDFLKKNGRRPNLKEAKEMAEDFLKNGFKHHGDIPSDGYFRRLTEDVNALEAIQKTREKISKALSSEYLQSEDILKPNKRKVDLSSVRVRPRDLMNSRIGKARPNDMRMITMDSSPNPPKVPVGDIVPSTEAMTRQNLIRPILRTSDDVQPIQRTWTNREGIQPASSPAPLRSITDENVGALLGREPVNTPVESVNQVAATADNAALRMADDAARVSAPVEPVATQPQGRTFPEPIIRDGLKERGFNRNVRTDMNMADELREAASTDPLTYEQLSNKTTLASAEARFAKGYESALEEWNNSLSTFRADDIPLARMLANEAVSRGDVVTARKVFADVSEKLTQAGQFSQAAKILRNQNDPGSFMSWLNRQLEKLNKQGQQRFGKSWENVQLTDDEMKLINSWGTMDDAGREKIMEQIHDRVQDQIPVTRLDQFDTWRRTAMLLNPKTHIRNIFGNSIMAVTRKTADTVATALERIARVPQGQRTKAVGWSKNKGLVDTVNKAWATNKDDLMMNSRWDLENLKFLGRDRRIFQNDFLNFLDNLSKDTLNFEDAIFMKPAYTDALGQYMSSNKLTEVTQEAADYAKRRALEATFRQANELSNIIQKLKNRGDLIGKAVDVAIPFSKTPANIAARAIDYSPVGLFKAMYSAGKGKSAATVIEDLAKGMTGTGIATLGFALASMDWARGERKASKNAEGILNISGDQPYSIDTPLGNYTWDFAQPISVPFAMGVAVYESLQKENNSISETIRDALSSGLDTIFNMTMLQNIKDLMGGGFGSVSEGLLSLPADYVTQAMPTLFGQVARTIDPVKRTTYDPDPLKQLGNTFLARTPVASKTLQPNLDVFGREQSQGGPLQQFINPGYSKEISSDPITVEVKRLYDSTKQTDFLPKVAPRKLTMNKQEKTLTPQQVTEFQREMGQENYKDIQKMINSGKYKNAVDEERAKLLRKIVDDNYDDTKEKMFKK